MVTEVVFVGVLRTMRAACDGLGNEFLLKLTKTLGTIFTCVRLQRCRRYFNALNARTGRAGCVTVTEVAFVGGVKDDAGGMG